MRHKDKILRVLYVAIITFIVSYVALMRLGLFSVAPAQYMSIFYSLPVYIASFALAATVLLNVLLIRLKSIWQYILLVSIIVAVSGFWVNILTMLDVSMVITEGQESSLEEAISGSDNKYLGKYAKQDEILFALRELTPEISSDGEEILELKAELELKLRGSDSERVFLTADKGHSYKGFDLSIKNFGYSPRYVLKVDNPPLHESAFVFLRLFPPGAEDYFRLLSPLTYFIQYFPGGDEAHYRVRVARNKDLLFSGNVRPGEVFWFENASMHFPEVRQWTVLTIRRTPGNLLVVIGMAGFLLASVVWAMKMRKHSN